MYGDAEITVSEESDSVEPALLEVDRLVHSEVYIQLLYRWSRRNNKLPIIIRYIAYSERSITSSPKTSSSVVTVTVVVEVTPSPDLILLVLQFYRLNQQYDIHRSLVEYQDQ